jgi:hypothetical protein
MRKCALSFLLFLALSAHATISAPVQSNATRNSTGTTCQVQFGANVAQKDLIAVWTVWSTSGANQMTVVSVKDSDGNGEPVTGLFPTAVGPTLQPASNTATQIFYANSTKVGTSLDTVFVTFSTPTQPGFSASCGIVELAGLDLTYPLDSVSAGYSYNTGAALDSGTVAPANANLFLFGAGYSDTATVNVGTGFTVIGPTDPSSKSVIEYEIVQTSGTPQGNLSLQRATATIGSPNTGNWVMQMAVFRDASSTMVGGWRPTRPPDATDATQYPGPDICLQAQNAAIANPYATILMPINGTIACSVDPTGGTSTSPVISAPAFHGKLRLVGVGGSAPQLNIDTPWTFFNSELMLDAGKVQFTTSNNFRRNWSGQRCWTVNATGDTSGDYGDCANYGVGSANFKIQPNSPAPNCATVTYPGSSNVAYQIRGGEIVSLTEMSDARNNGVFRVVPVGDATCGTGHSGPTTNTFYMWAPSAQTCSGTGCGTGATLAAQTAMLYMGPRPWDDPQNVGNSCITVAGADWYGPSPPGEQCNRYGIKLLNLGELDGWGYGVEGIDNSQCMEQCAIDSSGSRTTYRTSLLSYGQWSTVSQNNAAIQHFEDYCNNNTNNGTTYYCVSSGPFNYGVFHVGIWLRDTWTHMAIQDATINEPAWAGIMLDNMGTYNGSISIKGIHFQNSGKNNNAGSALANIAIGAQAAANGVYIEQTQTDLSKGTLANILIAGPNSPSAANLPDWQASNSYAPYDAILPTGGGGNIFENTVAGTSGTAPPGTWPTTPGNCVGDNGMTWCNVGNVFPNSKGVGGNMVDMSTIANNTTDTPTIINGQLGHTCTLQNVAHYTYQNDPSGAIVESGCSGVQSTVFTYPLANNGTIATVVNELAILTGTTSSTATVATTSSTTGVIGLVVAGAGMSGFATIQFGGVGLCAFDPVAVNAGDYVQASTALGGGGKCHDAGSAKPTSGQIIGRATTTGAASSTQSVFLQMNQ